MVEFRFGILRIVVDVLFILLLFFGFLCGIHYGTAITGLYFWFMKFLLGIVGLSAVLFVLRYVRTGALGWLKSCSIYAQCRDDCNSVLGAFSGIMKHFKSTVSIPVFNKLIRELLDEVKEKTCNAEELPAIFETFKNSKILRVSAKIATKAFDYVDECILGYCYHNVSEEKGIIRCALEAFVIFVEKSPAIFGKVITVAMLNVLMKVVFWVLFVLTCVKIVTITPLNVLLCYVIGKCLIFVLEDAVIEPLLMHEIIKSFKGQEWKNEYESKIQGFAENVSSFGKLGEMIGLHFSGSEESVEEEQKEEQKEVDLND